MKPCVARIFGQELRGTTSGDRVTDQADGSEWLYVHLETPTVIGGVGHPRDVIAVAPGAVEMLDEPSLTLEDWEAALLAEPSATDQVVGDSSPCLACLDDYDAHTCRPIDGDLVELQFADPRFR